MSDGAKNLGRELKKLGREYATKLGEEALLTGAEVLRMEMMRLAPKKTGRLAQSVEVSKARRGSNRHEIEALVGPEAWYAHFLENGTRHSAKRPFIRPAYAAKKRQSFEVIKRVLSRGVR